MSWFQKADSVRATPLSSQLRLGAVAFLYFAVLSPAIAFGGVMSTLTGGTLGVVETVASCGLSGMTCVRAPHLITVN